MGTIRLVFGLRGEGKSTLLNSLCLERGRRAVYYDPQGEVPATVRYDFYVPRDGYSVAEAERCLKTWIDTEQYNLVVIDEVNRFAPSKPAPLPRQFVRINDDCRHKNIDFILSARRPCTVNQDLTELADELDIFLLKGRNDLKYLDDICRGLSSKVEGLPPHHYIQYTGRQTRLCPPVMIDAAWDRREKRHKQTVRR